jgi:eukaryotic translation initiation factor 2C
MPYYFRFPLVQEDNKTVDCTVAKYFYDRYAIKLKYPLLPCLQVAPKEKNRFLPIEVCRITPGQRCVKKLTEQQTAQMIRQTARSASEREREIKQIISEAAFSDDPYVKEFELTIDPTMCKVTGRVLPAPHLITGDNSVVAAERGMHACLPIHQSVSLFVHLTICSCVLYTCFFVVLFF